MSNMVDVNSRIDWRAGMEITVGTFRQIDDSLDLRHQLTARVASEGKLGILSGETFSCDGAFVKNTLEIERFQCLALLPSGRIVNADEKVVLSVPMLYGDEYYLTVSIGDGQHRFEKEDVVLVRPEYSYAIQSFDEMTRMDCLPVMRFNVKDGVFLIDTDYIPPCLMLTSDSRLNDYISQMIEKLDGLTRHANLEEGEGKRCLLRYLFLLKGYNRKGRVLDFIQLTQEIAQAIDYYIITPNCESQNEIPAYSEYDIQKWLHWLDEYLNGAVTVLNGVVLEDHTIDFDELKAQIKAELYAQLRPELHDQLRTELKTELRNELEQELQPVLADYINGTVKESLHKVLHAELADKLSAELYDSLYKALYDALYVPVEESQEETFMPLI